MACDNIVGVKNILISFRNCDTGEVISNVAHKLANDELPKIRAYNYTNESLPGGYVKRNQASATIEMEVIRDRTIPLAYYQGAAALDVQIEMDNGNVFTGVSGSEGGEEGSDTHSATLMVIFKNIEELLPSVVVQ